MADVTPNYRLERKKAEVQIGQLNQNLLASELREMQLESDLEQVRTSMQATRAAIAEQQRTIASLPSESTPTAPAEPAPAEPAAAPAAPQE